MAKRPNNPRPKEGEKTEEHDPKTMGVPPKKEK